MSLIDNIAPRTDGQKPDPAKETAKNTRYLLAAVLIIGGLALGTHGCGETETRTTTVQVHGYIESTP